MCALFGLSPERAVRFVRAFARTGRALCSGVCPNATCVCSGSWPEAAGTQPVTDQRPAGVKPGPFRTRGKTGRLRRDLPLGLLAPIQGEAGRPPEYEAGPDFRVTRPGRSRRCLRAGPPAAKPDRRFAKTAFSRSLRHVAAGLGSGRHTASSLFRFRSAPAGETGRGRFSVRPVVTPPCSDAAV